MRSAVAAVAEVLPDGIVDAHHHVWDLATGHYPWLQEAYSGEAFFLGEYRQLCQNYLIDDLRRDVAPLRLCGTVHVEAERNRSEQIAETRWLASVRAREGLPSVFVGHASFLQPDLDAVLAAHGKYPGFRGIRCKPVTARVPGDSVRGEPGSMQDDAWLAGLARLATFGLSWDCRVPFWHLEEAAIVVGAIPAVPVILNHCGLPLDRSDEGLAAWRRGLAKLAEHSNVTVKLSEFGLPDGRWDARSTAMIVRDALAIMGVDRLLFGTNRPVSRLTASVADIVDAVVAGLGTVDPERLRRVFSTNARRVYRMNESTTPSGSTH